MGLIPNTNAIRKFFSTKPGMALVGNTKKTIVWEAGAISSLDGCSGISIPVTN